jgi:hypothetical protein
MRRSDAQWNAAFMRQKAAQEEFCLTQVSGLTFALRLRDAKARFSVVCPVV